MPELHAGVARAVITPPIGIPLVEFAGRGPSEAVHDDLTATILALESGGERALIAAADLLFFADPFQAEAREEIGRRTGIAAVGILLCPSHTHYGPPHAADDGSPPEVAAYLANLQFLLAGAAQAAVADLRPVRLGFGTGESRIGINRRERRPDGTIVLGNNPDGPCDREVRLVRLDTADGEPCVALVNFACHPVSPGGGMRQISADWVGVMRRMAEAHTGATVLFLQGACGNINPVEMRHSMEPARRLGTMLGGEVTKVFESTTTGPADGLAAAYDRIELPAKTFDTLDEAERSVAELTARRDALAAEGKAGGALWWTETKLARASAALESLRTGVPLPAVPAEIHVVRFGDVALATSPGEIFTETGMEIKRRSPFPRTLFAGYTNGSIGYVPVPSAYPEGGYEVNDACGVGPAAAGMIAESAVGLLARVRG